MRRDKPSPFNYADYVVLPRNIEIVMWPQITVTSLHPRDSEKDDESGEAT